jgi:hypothetical protein
MDLLPGELAVNNRTDERPRDQRRGASNWISEVGQIGTASISMGTQFPRVLRPKIGPDSRRTDAAVTTSECR